MIETVYHFLEGIGFTHPLHPAITHPPMGMVLGGVIFFFIYAVFNRPDFLTAAYYCTGLGFLGIFPAVLSGLLDWQYRLHGEWNPFIITKMVFAAGLALAMLATIKFSTGHEINSNRLMVTYFLCLVFIIGLGYMGGELLYAAH